jgi:hypothetical protein
MKRSAREVQHVFYDKGKNAAIQYCKDWKKETNEMVLEIKEAYAKRRIDAKTHNRRMSEVNDYIQKLNMCIKSLNDKFAPKPEGDSAE